MKLCFYEPELPSYLIKTLKCDNKSYEYKLLTSIQPNYSVNLWCISLIIILGSNLGTTLITQTLEHLNYIPEIKCLNLSSIINLIIYRMWIRY